MFSDRRHAPRLVGAIALAITTPAACAAALGWLDLWLGDDDGFLVDARRCDRPLAEAEWKGLGVAFEQCRSQPGGSTIPDSADSSDVPIAPLGYLMSRPAPDTERAPLLVVVHGIGRNAENMARAFGAQARERGYVLVAPYFDERVFDDYQRLGRRGRGARADLALLRLIDELAEAGVVDPARVAVVGYSGGAQFAHRFALAHPGRVLAASAAGAGWFLWPDDSAPYPYGLRDSVEQLGIDFEPERFLQVPLLVFAGSLDTARDADLRTGPEVDRAQGRTRLERARRFVGAMRLEADRRGLASQVALHTLFGAEHSLVSSAEHGFADAAVDFFAETMARAAATSGAPLSAGAPTVGQQPVASPGNSQ